MLKLLDEPFGMSGCKGSLDCALPSLRVGKCFAQDDGVYKRFNREGPRYQAVPIGQPGGECFSWQMLDIMMPTIIAS